MGAVAVQDKPYTFRPYELGDIPFIQSSWGNSYYSDGYGNALLKAEDFHRYHRPIRESVLNKPNVAIIVCSYIKDPDFILGFSIVEKPKDTPILILHYIYVKYSFRGEGIARELFDKSIQMRPVLYTHETTHAAKLIDSFDKSNKDDFDRFIYSPHVFKGDTNG